MNTFIVGLLAALGGYVASIFTWPRLRRTMIGAENELDALRAKLRALEQTLRG